MPLKTNININNRSGLNRYIPEKSLIPKELRIIRRNRQRRQHVNVTEQMYNRSALKRYMKEQCHLENERCMNRTRQRRQLHAAIRRTKHNPSALGEVIIIDDDDDLEPHAPLLYPQNILHETGAWKDKVQDNINGFTKEEELFAINDSLETKCKTSALEKEVITIEDDAASFTVEANEKEEEEQEQQFVPFESATVHKDSKRRHDLNAPPVRERKRKYSALKKVATVPDDATRLKKKAQISLANEHVRKHNTRKQRETYDEEELAGLARMCMRFRKILKKYKKILDKGIMDQMEEIKLELSELIDEEEIDWQLDGLLDDFVEIKREWTHYQQSTELVDYRLVFINRDVRKLKQNLLKYKMNKTAEQGEMDGEDFDSVDINIKELYEA